MQQTFLNIFKKYFNVFKELTDSLFCLVAYICPKSRKDDAVLAVTKRSGLSLKTFSLSLKTFQENTLWQGNEASSQLNLGCR